MNKMLIATFNNEEDAYKGVDALKELNEKGDITLYASAVISKSIDGKVDVKQVSDEGPIGTAFGVLTGSLAGLIGGIPGAALGVTLGGTTGMLFDLAEAGVNIDFANEVADVLLPGTSVLISDIEEEWVIPVDTKLSDLSGLVIRRSRSEVVEDQLENESIALNKQMEDLKQELKNSKEDAKTAVKQTQASLKKRLEAVSVKTQAKLDQLEKESEAKIKTFQNQLKSAQNERKAKIEKRISDIKADREIRKAKLEKAKKLTQEALKP